ncbi:MAG: nucleotidyltransferase domain-containing protein [Pirellulales bacterium]|nr:nucleotidyltransferase domain-containing protein [Pirellulales bacterium]
MDQSTNALTTIMEKRGELAELCGQFSVRRLELFGSAAVGGFDPSRSDFDFLVEFERDPKTNAFHQYFDFQKALSRLLGREVDLVVEGALRNPYFIRTVNQSRTIVYAA